MKIVAAFLSALPMALSAAGAAPPEEDYVINCAGCHRFDGSGTPGLSPTLHGLARLLEVEGGRAYLSRVPGVAHAPLGDERLSRLLNWVLEEFSGSAPSPPYTSEEVGRLRRVPLRDTASARERLDVRLDARSNP